MQPKIWIEKISEILESHYFKRLELFFKLSLQ